ncbi:hypothetical protein PCASD_18934 [Puccinia coronata f. sp. avenae]|uniref:Uncharacterized protein n=1 Tax=Puccinia coronata f. sp. avenae TaxID=200324 RepID=A0A2N5T9M6_9BASI|nr:hypothetical protein PCASD_18934 [Puccinia coronata f. sp. avenae]
MCTPPQTPKKRHAGAASLPTQACKPPHAARLPHAYKWREDSQLGVRPRRTGVLAMHACLEGVQALHALRTGVHGWHACPARLTFVKGKDLKKELESMEGYDDRDWKTLRKSMLDVWGCLPLKICYTIQDLYDLIKLCQDKGGIKDIKDFRIYQSKFMMITKYLVRNKHIPAKTSVSHLFFLAFPREYQVSINR